jgi:hypothetical protein
MNLTYQRLRDRRGSAGVVRNPHLANPQYPADDYLLRERLSDMGFVPFNPDEAGRFYPRFNPPAVPATIVTMPFNPATDF